MLQNLVDIIAAPTSVLARLREKPVFLVPLLILMACTVSIQIGYFMLNDPVFIHKQIIEQAIGNREVTAEQIKQIETTVGNVSISTIAASSTAAVLILLPVVLALNGWYLSFMSKFSFNQLGFTHWFSLLCWTTVPSVFASLAAWAILLSDPNGHVSQVQLQPLSITGLLGLHVSNATLQQLNLTQLWSIALAAIGYRQWTKVGWTSAILITAAPSLIIYGAIAFFTR